jgi:hypothetical protein
MMARCCILIAIVCASSADEAWEWANVFQLDNPTPQYYLWTMQKVDGAYADAEATFSITPTISMNEEGVHHVETEVLTLWESTVATNVTAWTVLTPNIKYNLVFNDSMPETTFFVQVPTAGPYVITFQHVPMEFELDKHFLKDVNGFDIEGIGETEKRDTAFYNTALLNTLAANVIRYNHYNHHNYHNHHNHPKPSVYVHNVEHCV